MTDAPAAPAGDLDRLWLRRAVLVLRRPREVFAAIADSVEEDDEARQEPLLALVLLAGVAVVVSLSATSRELLDDPEVDGALAAVLLFLAGALYGIAGYWLGGLALYLGLRGTQVEDGTYRESRHLLGYSLAPLAVSLFVMLPVRLLAFGGDGFRSGGRDEGPGEWALTGVSLVFVVWSLALLVVGIRTVYGWTTIRALGALLVTSMTLLGLGLVVLVVGRA